MQGFVTYSNEAKQRMLGVKASTLAAHGAVSAECAEEMARGGCLNGNTDVAISITGIAGPGGGTEEKPVGLVYIGCGRKHHIVVKQYHFSGNRTQIREACVENALIQLWEVLTEKIEKKEC